eukprot:926822-Pyramimonas_sp.AAC.1
MMIVISTYIRAVKGLVSWTAFFEAEDHQVYSSAVSRRLNSACKKPVSYTHLRAHETGAYL